jgi:hypothetical protein
MPTGESRAGAGSVPAIVALVRLRVDSLLLIACVELDVQKL